ncbi:McrB family protein [Actinoplanes solisilvae]|uniref:McrB family protein n=1 Tax=Actinoplanes solisilvae TaxID=2486853 RepID=UPI0013E33BE1|nr:AAA family ATPase [Actinoplanes solisilvae]
MPSRSTAEIVEEVRTKFGERFVPARQAAEDEVRAFINAHLGAMDAARIVELGRLINRHEIAGRDRYDRFSPGFTGAIMERLGRDPETFNRMVSRLWRDPEENALAVLGEVYANRRLFPHAGSSLPSFLLYLRDPDRFGICVNATMNGLAVQTSTGYRATGLEEYQRFCADLRDWRQRHRIAPQEADAILTTVMRYAREESAEAGEVTVEPVDPHRLTANEVAALCYLPVELIDQWAAALRTGMRQAVFHGPPGTGKTHVAMLLARHLASSAEHIEVTQFHPAYSYEDFIEGLRPETEAAELKYVVRDGVFARLCARASIAPDETFVLIIDEMNRADLAAVFGELLYLLEYRGTGKVTLPYSQRTFTVPPNVFLLGTMNTADRSLALLDFALRRRFNAFPLLPDAAVLERWTAARSADNAELALGVFRLIRDRVGHDTPVSPGHSYWMTERLDAAAAERVWDYQLRPYLAEYWFEQPAELKRLDGDVRSLIAELA